MSAVAKWYAKPKLRFLEFEEVWEPIKAGEVFSKGSERGSPDLPIYSVTTNYGMVRRDSLERHLSADASYDKNLKVEKGDLAYNTMRMWQGAVGVAIEDCMVSPAYIVLKPAANIDSSFFAEWFKTHKMLYLLSSYSHGLTSDRLRLYYGDFAKIPIALPTLSEQRKIKSFLSAIDDKVAALEAQLVGWRAFKRGMLQALFSAKLRFTANDGSEFPDWELKPMSSSLKAKSSSISASALKPHGRYPVFGADGISGYSDSFDHDIEYISIVKDGAGVGRVKFLPANSSIVGTSTALLAAPKSNLRFFGYFLQQFPFRKFITGSTIPHIYFRDYGKVKVPTPSPLEQKKIADYLSALDSKIDALSERLDATQEFKHGLLQMMFV